MLGWALSLLVLTSMANGDEESVLTNLGGTTAVLNSFKTQSGCSTPNAATLCRHFPWVLRPHEGVWELGGTGIVAYEFPEEDSSHYLAPVWSKINKDYVDLHLTVHVLGDPGVMKGISTSPYSSIAFIAVKKTPEGLRPLSILVAPTMLLVDFEIQVMRQLREDLAKALTNWIPPVDTQIPGQFVKF